MSYTPILTRSEFEQRIRLSDHHGTGTPRDQHIDFKSEFKKADTSAQREVVQREFARDIAQFANSDGGTLIVGIHAPKDPATNRETAKSVAPIVDVGELLTRIEDAISNYLYPAVVRPRPLPLDPWDPTIAHWDGVNVREVPPVINYSTVVSNLSDTAFTVTFIELGPGMLQVPRGAINVPYDYVRAVWLTHEGHVAIDLSLRVVLSQQGTQWQFVPI